MVLIPEPTGPQLPWLSHGGFERNVTKTARKFLKYVTFKSTLTLELSEDNFIEVMLKKMYLIFYAMIMIPIWII